MERFLAAKTIEGCSPKTIRYYKATLTRALEAIKNQLSGLVQMTYEHT